MNTINKRDSGRKEVSDNNPTQQQTENTQQQVKESMTEKPFLYTDTYKTSQFWESISISISEVNPWCELWFDDVENNEYCYTANISWDSINIDFTPWTEDQEIIIQYTCIPKSFPGIPKDWLNEKQYGNIIIDYKNVNK